MTLYTGSLEITGGQTVTVSDGAGDPVLVPAGAHCFAAETDSGGATSSTVDFESFDNAVVAGNSDDFRRSASR